MSKIEAMAGMLAAVSMLPGLKRLII